MVQLERDFHDWRTTWLSFHQPATRRRRGGKKRNDEESYWREWMDVCRPGCNWSMYSTCPCLFSLAFCTILRWGPTAMHAYNVMSPSSPLSLVERTNERASECARARVFSATATAATWATDRKVWVDGSKLQRVGQKKKCETVCMHRITKNE